MHGAAAAVEALAVAGERRRRRTAERLARAVEPGEELAEVGHDEPRGHARRGGAHVGDEVAQRRVLLVADRRDDRHRAGGDGAHDPLVAERQQVLEAAAAAREHDHVDAGRAQTSPSAVDERRRRPRPLDVGLGDEHVARAGSGS